MSFQYVIFSTESLMTEVRNYFFKFMKKNSCLVITYCRSITALSVLMETELMLVDYVNATKEGEFPVLHEQFSNMLYVKLTYQSLWNRYGEFCQCDTPFESKDEQSKCKRWVY